jgi:hypothetical protein
MSDKTKIPKQLFEKAASSPEKATRNKPTRTLPTTRVSISNQLNLARGFVAASGPSGKAVSLEEVAAVTNSAAYTLQIVVPFLADIGLVQRLEQKGEAWRYLPSQAVITFARAYEWNRESAAQKLAPTISTAWFCEALLPRLNYASSLDRKEAIAILAEACAATPAYQGALEFILDFMAAVGVIQAENGTVKLNTRPAQAETEVSEPARPQERVVAERAEPLPRASAVSTAFVQPTLGVVNFHVDVKIDMAEFATWSSDRISAFFTGIAQVLSAKSAIESEQGVNQS